MVAGALTYSLNAEKHRMIAASVNDLAFLIIVVMSTFMVLCSIVCIRRTIREHNHVPPYQCFTVAFFVSTVLFTIFFLLFLCMDLAYHEKYILGPYFDPEYYPSVSTNE